MYRLIIYIYGTSTLVLDFNDKFEMYRMIDSVEEKCIDTVSFKIIIK